MMWPRLRLLHELLSDTGSLWMTLDDNEVHRGRHLLEEIFGDSSLVGQIAWQKRTSRENRAVLSPSFDHLIVYSKCSKDIWRTVRNLLEPKVDGYSNPDNDPRGPWTSIPFSAQGFRKNQVYPIESPSGRILEPPRGRCWGATEPEFKLLLEADVVYWPKEGDSRPRIKQFPAGAKGLVPETLWTAEEVGDTEDSKKLLLQIFSDQETVEFHAPKPPALIERVIHIAARSCSLILDSFAGTAATAHAALAANARDGGNRKFILVECEDYADVLTAERVRRVINGYSFSGTQREELLREKITFTKLKQADSVLERVQAIENLDGYRFDRIAKSVDDGELIVTGEKRIEEHTEGLGGSFTFCTLGSPIDLDALLTCDSLPAFEAFASVLFHMATNKAFDAAAMDCDALGLPGHGYLGPGPGHHVWLIYQPDLDFLKSADAALTLSKARDIAAYRPGEKHVVYAPSRFVSQKLLNDEGIKVEFAPLPFALYRLQGA